MMSKLNFSLSNQECVNNRKRKIQVSEWQDKERKALKDSGQPCINTVSYTHLDVYKRQILYFR